MPKHRLNKLLSADSNTVWNVTISPGWNKKEIHILRLAVMKFGLGNWRKIHRANVLPGKTVNQIVSEVQRMIGQQSLKEFLNVHADPYAIGDDNSKRKDVKRKNGMIVNVGKTLTNEEYEILHKSNIQKYGLSKEEIDAIEIPVISQEESSGFLENEENMIIQRSMKLRKLSELRYSLLYLQQKDHTNANNHGNLDIHNNLISLDNINSNIKQNLSNRKKTIKRLHYLSDDEDDDDEEEDKTNYIPRNSRRIRGLSPM
ncbi:hypothetical protein WA158_004865 [Blastocystis sp. Blastoise]